MGETQGGAPAAARLLVEHGATLGRVCMALLGDGAEVERALEQTARDACTREREGRGAPGGASARAWIFGLARAACATRLSKAPLRNNTNLTGPRQPEADAPPRTERLGAREAAAARAQLAALKPTEREAVVLHAVGGLDADEVAVACGVDVATARARIAQGMAKLVEGGAR